MRVKWIAALLIMCTLITIPHVTELVFATSVEDEANDKKDEAQEDLNNVNSEMEDIKENQNEVLSEIEKTKKKLKKLLAQQEELAEVIEETQKAIEQTEEELKKAEEEERKQYEAMKLRIQYMYQNSAEDSIWSALFEAKGLADLLNRVEYIAQVHKTDRELTEEYQATVDKIREKKETLLLQMEDLLGQEEAYLGQQQEIEEMIADLKDEEKEYASQLTAAKKKADKLKEVIKEQERIIEQERKRREEEERRRREEEERKKREEEERKKREEEERKKQEALQNQANKNDEEDADKELEEILKQNTKGTEIVKYALQFVGNPYVWGGNSLTKGCDCSGFVHLVYKNFGFSTPRYSMSFLNVGTPVSLDEIQPGDIVVYNKKRGIGHVAIYIGNGKIVEAQSSDEGITKSRDVDCRSIAGIRRLVNN